MDIRNKVFSLLEPLWSDVDRAGTFPAKRPLLAHYTSIETLERIVANNELWLSNPLFMNDIEELRFGILEGRWAFVNNEAVKGATGTAFRHKVLRDSFEACFHQFNTRHAFDVYVFCFSEHEPSDSDGLLSMWRGYGGNGNGAAIVLNTAKFDALGNSPIILANVHYGSAEKRRQWVDSKMVQFATLVKEAQLGDDELPAAAEALFERIKLFALFTKHSGFSEEKEWRMVYLRERDAAKALDSMLGYSVGRNGVEPRLKLKIEPIEGVTANELSLDHVIDRIILGPTVSNPAARFGIQRMLESHNRHSLAGRVAASTTPFRPR